MRVEVRQRRPHQIPADQSERSGVTLYVQVGDLRASLAKAAELGGTVVAEPFQFPGTPTLASIEDPEGNPVMLVQQ